MDGRLPYIQGFRHLCLCQFCQSAQFSQSVKFGKNFGRTRFDLTPLIVRHFRYYLCKGPVHFFCLRFLTASRCASYRVSAVSMMDL